jgi:hypothetical protein
MVSDPPWNLRRKYLLLGIQRLWNTVVRAKIIQGSKRRSCIVVRMKIFAIIERTKPNTEIIAGLKLLQHSHPVQVGYAGSVSVTNVACDISSLQTDRRSTNRALFCAVRFYNIAAV